MKGGYDLVALMDQLTEKIGEINSRAKGGGGVRPVVDFADLLDELMQS